MRFAFYGRVSTEDQQDPTSSKGWQLSRCNALISPVGGEVVTEYFDIGQSRSLPWKRRPESARLLADLARPDRGFEAVVIGEPARAFFGGQFGLTFPIFTHYGVGLWVPEVGGAIDPGSDAHEMILALYGGMSKGERNRIKIRVRSAMASQTAMQGRFLGGRPPYGYQLGDAGAHPNPSKAAVGQRLHQLEVDVVAAPVVVRIFAEYIAGAGLYAIAEGLTADGIPSPSAHDPGRNRHRNTGGAWSKSAIRAILQNPRYTGRQVWGRQRRDEVLLDVDDVALGHQSKMRWNDRADWVWSAEPTHEAIITPDDFALAQTLRGAGASRPAEPKRRRAEHPYLLRRMVRCGVCGRAMDANWNNGRAHYRCRFPAEYAQRKGLEHPRTVYLRESLVVPALDAWLAQLFDDDHIDATCEAMAAGQEVDEATTARAEAARRKLIDCDGRLAKYRSALEGGADPTIVATWIAEVQADRLMADREVAASRPAAATSAAELRGMVEGLTDLAGVLAEADPKDKAEVYADLGLSLTWYPEDRRVVATISPADHVPQVVSEGRTTPEAHAPLLRGELLLG